ncbi:MAG: MFS transporter [Candidatus Binatia bacterium]
MPERNSFRWTILTLITISHIIGAGAQYGINTLAPFYQHDLQLSRAQIGLFFTAFYLGMAGLSLGAGWLADRLGIRGTALSGHLGLGIFTIVAALAPSFGWAFISFFLAGLGYSFLNPATTKGVMIWFHQEERATAMGIKQTGVPAGGVVAAVVGPSLVLYAGWRVALAGLGVINLLFGFCFWSLWREPEDGLESPELPVPSSQKVKSIPKLKNLLTVSLGTSVLLLAQMSLLTYIPLYLKEIIGFSAYWAGQSLAFIQVGAITGRIGWGIVSDRLFQGQRKIVLVLIGFLSVALTLGLGLIPRGISLFVLLPLIFLAGLCMVGYQGVSYALIGELAGSFWTGTALGIVITVNAVGALVGTPLFGYLVDSTGSYSIAWQALGGLILLGTLALSFFLVERENAVRS